MLEYCRETEQTGKEVTNRDSYLAEIGRGARRHTAALAYIILGEGNCSVFETIFVFADVLLTAWQVIASLFKDESKFIKLQSARLL